MHKHMHCTGIGSIYVIYSDHTVQARSSTGYKMRRRPGSSDTWLCRPPFPAGLDTRGRIIDLSWARWTEQSQTAVSEPGTNQIDTNRRDVTWTWVDGSHLIWIMKMWSGKDLNDKFPADQSSLSEPCHRFRATSSLPRNNFSLHSYTNLSESTTLDISQYPISAAALSTNAVLRSRILPETSHWGPRSLPNH